MLSTSLTLEWWDASSREQKQEVALKVEKSLVPSMQFSRLKTFALGGQTHTIALFVSRREASPSEFALLPGYSGLLGYDSALVPNALPGDEEDGENGMDAAQWRAYVEETLTPVRHVDLRPFLIATSAILVEVPKTYANGVWTYSGETIRRDKVVQQLATEGFRVPYSDEWEYACSGGTRSLFRWGDAWPPIQWSPQMQRGLHEWSDDLRPNAFGLHIAQHPWNLEYCMEPSVMRGGDGGTAVSADGGRLAEWFVLASAYCFPFLARRVNLLRQAYPRYTLPLPDTI